ncbi:VOC family protein [Shimia isoporae]|nr:VOC family protein [Shimia isoporae]
MLELDHLAVAGESLEAAVAHVEDALGVKMLPGGQHARYGTHNQLLGLGDGLYLEAIATDPSVGSLPHARWFDLDRFEGSPRLGNWICRSDDLEADVASIPLDVGLPVALTRGDLRWRMAVPDSGVLPYGDCFPALMQWDVSPTPASLLAGSGCTLLRLEVAHPDAGDLQAAVPLIDPRIVYVEGTTALRASFDTPHGKRVLQ